MVPTAGNLRDAMLCSQYHYREHYRRRFPPVGPAVSMGQTKQRDQKQQRDRFGDWRQVRDHAALGARTDAAGQDVR